MFRISTWAAFICTAALLTGCGGSDTGSKKVEADYSTPESTFQTACLAAANGDFDAFLACLDEESQTRLKKACELGKAIGEVRPSDNVKLSAGDLMKAIAKDECTLAEPKVEGDSATAEVIREGSDAAADTMTFTKVGDDWKIVAPITDKDVEAMEAEVQRAKDMLQNKADAAK